MNISLSPEILFYIGIFPVTNAFFWSIILSLFLILLTLYINKRLKQIPGKLQNIAEVVVEGGMSFVNSITNDKKKTKRLFPLIITMFIFIAIANLITIIPGQSAITLHKPEGTIPLFRAVMSDYSMVFVLTMITIIIVQVVAIITNGPFGYLGKFFNFKNIFKNPKSLPLDLFLGFMDLVGEISKILSLSFRLFGNIFAGEVLTAVMLFLLPFFAPLPFLFLTILTAIVQAFVFSMLTLVFISMASEIDQVEI